MILISGSTGHFGKATIEHLLKKGFPKNEIAALARNPEKAKALVDFGIQVRLGDYNDPNSLEQAFQGIDKLVMISSNDLSNRVKQHANIIQVAQKTGIEHLLYTSFVRKENPEKSPISFIAMEHIETERMIKESGIPSTILLNALYSDVLPMFMGNSVVENGIFLPGGTGKAAFTSREDMAEATAILLTESGHENQTYVFSGTENYSFADIAALLSELSGKLVPYHQVTVEQYLETVTSKGMPKDFAQFLAAFSQSISLNEFKVEEADLERILGRKPQTLKNYLQTIYFKHN